MSLCFVFSGTSEGREICERLAENDVKCLCFVATEYGSQVMKSDKNIDVRVGRLDKDEIIKEIKLQSPDYIIDATHPHAQIITENIISACDELSVSTKYLRVSRDIEFLDDNTETVTVVNNVDEAIDVLKDIPGKIMLTTGVKELKDFVVEGIADRLVVRILPGRESIDEVIRLGIPSKAVIAMEGPFSKDMNEALIRQYEASVLVTKNSGSRGGFKEKIDACISCGIKAVVIKKQNENDDHISVDEAFKLVKGLDAKTEDKKIDLNVKQTKRVNLIGVGMCNKKHLTFDALEKIKEADVIIGASRMINFAKTISNCAEYYTEYMPEKVLEIISQSDYKNIAVLFSGDTGLCSGAKGVYEVLKANTDYEVRILPGISSVSYFASKIGVQYSDYQFISLHGNPHGENVDCLRVLTQAAGFIAICSGIDDVKTIASRVFNFDGYILSVGGTILSAKNIKIVVGYNLGATDEEIIEISDIKSTDNLKEGLYIIFVTKKDE